MSSNYEIYCHFRMMDPDLARDIDWYCSLPEDPPTPEWDVCVGLTPFNLTWFTIESNSMDWAAEEAMERWRPAEGESFGPDDELIYQVYRDGELIDEEMYGKWPVGVYRLDD